MNVEIGTEAPIFLFWEYLFRICGILSLQCGPSVNFSSSCFLTSPENGPQKIFVVIVGADGHHFVSEAYAQYALLLAYAQHKHKFLKLFSWCKGSITCTKS